MNNQEMQNLVQGMLAPKRFAHSLGVRDCALQLAHIHGVDAQRCSIAAILHDCAKGLPKKELYARMQEYGLFTLPLERLQSSLWHAPVGAYMAEHLFGVKDREILLAIRYHTTGRAGMSDMEMIVYLADMIEPGRDFQGVDSLRRLAQRDLEAATIQGLQGSMRFVLENEELLHPDTLHARNDLLMRRITQQAE